MVEEDLFYQLSTYAGLSTYVDDRIFPIIMPQNPTFPAITYQRISTNRTQAMDGATGHENPWFQIDIWSENYSELKAIEIQLLGAMDAATAYTSLLQNRQDQYESGLEIYRATLDFSAWDNEG